MKCSIIVRKAREMTASRNNQLTAEVEAVFFRLREIKEDDNNELDTMPAGDSTSCVIELKDLRVTLVAVNRELNLVSNEYEFEKSCLSPRSS